MKIIKKKVEVKAPVKVEVSKKDKLKTLLAAGVYKLFDQEPRGSIQSAVLDQLADEILAL